MKNFLKKLLKSPHHPQNDWAAFYQRFEDRFRGSYEHVEEMLTKRYEEMLRSCRQEIAKISDHQAIKALDLGCGRGEMLQLMDRLGFQTIGVDLSQEALSQIRQKDIKLVTSDILKFLKQQAPAEYDVVSCLHVIEHCPPEYFRNVVKEVYRVLKKRPSSLFLLETPSLYSLWASARQFYLDPTHLRPVHPEYMRFLLEDSGFKNLEHFLFDPPQEEEVIKSIPNGSGDTERQKLQSWLYGPLDFALLARAT